MKQKTPLILTTAVVAFGCAQNHQSKDPVQATKDQFKGVINLDVRKSVPDWTNFLPKKAPEGAPNILFVLFDDTGIGAWSTYGGRINMPTLDKLAANGLIYTQWHTCALSSPTRSTLLTGRNHNLNGMDAITETSMGFPGHNGHIPVQCATIGQILQDNGWSTFWVGKDHNVPEQDAAPGGNKSRWPLQMGFDRFYGFIGGETNQYYPDLVEDNRFIEQPYGPEQGYHLSKDLADQAIRMISDLKAAYPNKPFYMWFCPGANHAPHQAPQEYIDKYRGKFDDGYDAYREWVLKRMIDKGIMPEGTKLTPFNPLPDSVAYPPDYVRPWNTLSDDEKKLFSRLCEVYAAYSEYTDAQVGRIIDYLEQTKQLENTVIIYAADNGASGEGSPNGSVNENKYFNMYPDNLAENMKLMNELGGPDSYEHYPTGWAAAFSAPFKMFKRYGSFAGGTCDPLVICWPKGIKAHGELRHQYHHSVDIVPTILEITGLTMPEVYKGVQQYPLSGISMCYTFDAAPDAPTRKHIQYYSMMGTRGLWKDGWKVASLHAPMTGKGHFEEDEWQLYNTDNDRSESTDLSAQYPEKLKELVDAWYEEADKNLALPLIDLSPLEGLTVERPTGEPPHDRYLYFPNTSPVPEGVAVNIRGRSYKIIANIEITGPDCSGVIFAHGSRFGGHSLFIKNNKLYYVYNFLGIKPEQKLVSGELEPGMYTVGAEFIMEKKGDFGEFDGTAKLYINEEMVSQGPWKTQPGKFTLCGDGLCVGYDSGDAVSEEYRSPFAFMGGNIQGVAVTVENTDYLDLEQEARRVHMKD
jgi:arylsulfatase A-like enzyme